MSHGTSNSELDALVGPTRLHKRLYTDPEIFELEMQRIWGQAWIFIGHASQIPNAGDFFTTHINHRVPVVMVRDKAGDIHVLHNRCAHKGAKLVEERQGNVPGAFRCAYHGWTYRHDGTLLKIPNPSGYDDTGFDMSSPCNNMQKVAQYDSYRGFVFATLSPDAPDLQSWLGGAVDCLDNLCDRAPEGEVEVAGGVLRYEHQCNWKFILENLNDTMHPMVVHQSVVQAAEDYIATLPAVGQQGAQRSRDHPALWFLLRKIRGLRYHRFSLRPPLRRRQDQHPRRLQRPARLPRGDGRRLRRRTHAGNLCVQYP